jgi:cell pole-organizing protein PopZ
MSDENPQKDPSMDDILSSIRKIIQEDEGRVAAGGEPAGPAAAASGPTIGIGVPIGGSVQSGGSFRQDEDILLLTDLVEEPDSRPDRTTPQPAAAAVPPAPASTIADVPTVSPAVAATAPQETMSFTAASTPPAAAEPGPVAQQPVETQPMTSNPISSAMDRLARAVEDAKPPVAAPEPGPTMGNGRTLEDLVKEMLRPMLQDWIDKNLPQLVERIVDREVQRLTRG